MGGRRVIDTLRLSAEAAIGLVERREVSAAELHAAYLEAIAERDGDLHAYLRTVEEPSGDRIPIAMKDVISTMGVETTAGSKILAGYVPVFDATVAARCKEAGLSLLGKTNTDEFAMGSSTENSAYGPSRNPWDPERVPGGSGGGSAAAVAAGLVPVAQGSDGGGSIRIPASCCGLVGLKPTRGRISGHPMYGDPVGLATAGPIARTVRDAAAMLDVLAGRRTGDPFWAPAPATSFLSACDRVPGRLRVARFVAPVIADVEVDPSCVEAWEDASRLLESLGHEVVDIGVPLPPDSVPVFETCWAVLTALSDVPPEREHLLRPLTRWLTERGRAVSGPEFGLAIGAMRRLAAEALTALAPYDAVLTPTLATPPLPVGALRDDDDPAADFQAQKEFTPWTSAWNCTGMPAVSLPLHWTPDGLPVGVMLAARPAEEALLLALSAQVEQAAPWSDRRPPGW
jgi:amidase